ncbi:MAG: hypothetical protein F6K00_27570 [Leptolyngbya sp. SIOISBB]|nr:hypothetical protein [Leptolyngbya sp. SIOISBB]
MPLQLPPTELQCLLWLLCYPNYRAATAVGSPPLPQLSATRRDRLWQQLQDRGFVDFEVIVTRFGIATTGRTLLQLDTSVLPVTPDEKYVLQSCRDRSIHPDQICHKVPTDQRQALIAGLAQQGLIRITQQHLGEIWLTAAGETFLRDECAPQGETPAVSWTLLSAYLAFMRRTDQTPTATRVVTARPPIPIGGRNLG